jgi:NAD(P) transhydrogenase subunit alpha
LVNDGNLAPDFDDEIVAGTCVVRAGQVVHAPTAEALGLPAPRGPADVAAGRPAEQEAPKQEAPKGEQG